jgi:hypothetical protein
LTPAAYAGGPLPLEILQQIDQRRLPQSGYEADVVITPSKDGQPQEPGHYVIRANGDSEVVVEAKNPDQRGQKFLTTSSGIFFYSPRSKRAIRMTPLQTLRGQASIGDISRLHFSTDYDAVKPAALQSRCSDQDCVVLELTSKNPESTYARIVLTAKHEKNGYRAVSADLYLASGKHAKTVEFGSAVGELPAPARYIDVINTRLETRVVFDSFKQAKFPSSMFNPRSLE